MALIYSRTGAKLATPTNSLHSPDYGWGGPQQQVPSAPAGGDVDYFKKDGAKTIGSNRSTSTLRTGGSSSSEDYTTTQTWKPSKALPTTEAGKFSAPEFNEGRISEIAQRLMAPGVRRLRGEVRRSQNETYDNPNAKRMVMRDALAGYGQGLESVSSGAYRGALSQYNSEYSREYNESMTNFNAAENARGQNFQAMMNEWSKTGVQTTSRSGSSTGSGGAAEGSYNTPTGNLGYYGLDGKWHDGMPSGPNV